MRSEQEASRVNGFHGIEVLVISLARANERRRLMSAQLEIQGLPTYRFIDALDARTADPALFAALSDKAASIRQAGRELTAAEIACAYSHQLAYEHIVARGLPAAVVLEDDALISHQFATVLERLLPRLSESTPQVILLSHVERYSTWRGHRVDKLRRLYRPYEAYGAHAYLINSTAARSMLARLRPVHAVADAWCYFASEGVVEVQGLVPYLVGTSLHAMQSSIESERKKVHGASRVPEWLYRYVWRKFMFQFLVKPLLQLRRDKSTW